MDLRIRFCMRLRYGIVVLLLFAFISSTSGQDADDGDDANNGGDGGDGDDGDDANNLNNILTGALLGWCDSLNSKYSNYEETYANLNVMASLKPDNIQVYSIGKTVKGKEMFVVKFAKDVNRRTIGKPLIKFLANIKGDEAVGRSIVLLIACDIFKAYVKNNEDARYIYHTVDIHLLPSANPDGYEVAFDKADKNPVSKEECENSWRPKGTKNFTTIPNCTAELEKPCTKVGRCNAQRIELNRNFYAPYKHMFPDLPSYMHSQTSEDKRKNGKTFNKTAPETQNIMNWIKDNSKPFVLSVAYEAGPPVVRIPYDAVPPYISYVFNFHILIVSDNTIKNYKLYQHGAYSFTPDEEMFQILASVYTLNSQLRTKKQNYTVPDCSCRRIEAELLQARHMCTNAKELDLNCTMSENGTIIYYTYLQTKSTPKKPGFCSQFHEFKEDVIITNGAYWKSNYGSMQDYNYVYSNCFEFTVHTGTPCNYPPASQIEKIYEDDHQKAAKRIIEALSHHMVFGVVSEIDKNKNKKPVVNATIIIEGNEKNITTSDQGEYWRLLNAGSYIMTVRHSHPEKEQSCSESRKISVSRTIARREDFILKC